MSDLTPVEYAMLILLRNENRELSNTEMAKLYGVRLVSPLYEKLNADGLVVSATKSRPYRHSISPNGRKALAKGLPAEPEADGSEKRTFKEQVLWAAVVAQHNTGQHDTEQHDTEQHDTEQHDTEQHDTGQRADHGKAPAGNGSVSLDDRIRAAYQVLTDGPGEWVNLTKIRGLFIDVPSTDLDRALTDMLDASDVWLEPEVHRHRIDAKLREAAVRIGGEDRHKLAIGQS
jgi:hypothetical protein